MTELATPFMSSFFIILREGFEAMLIAMLVFMFLDKMNARHQRPAVFWGMGAGVLVSLLLAVGFRKIHGMTGAHEEIFEGCVMLIASGMLAYCALFCHNAKEHVEGKVDKAIDSGKTWLLSFTVFLAIVREGFEVVLFYAALFATGAQSINAVVFGAVIGFAALVASYYGLRRLTKIVPIGMFFRASAVFLLIMSAYFGYEGVHELVEGLEDLKVL